MVRIYYHIYAIDGVDEIIDEQIALIEKYFKFPFILNIGICTPKENTRITNILDKFYDCNKPNYRIRDIRVGGNEFTTLDLIEIDKENFGDSDYILYIHTKGSSKINTTEYSNIISWRHLMNYFNIECVSDVIRLFENTEFNSYGVLLSNVGKSLLYSGNFWWMKGDYAKTIDITNIKRNNRYNAESHYVQCGIDWKPYSPYNRDGENHYDILFKKEEYGI
jgi:hypothetical protein